MPVGLIVFLCVCGGILLGMLINMLIWVDHRHSRFYVFDGHQYCCDKTSLRQTICSEDFPRYSLIRESDCGEWLLLFQPLAHRSAPRYLWDGVMCVKTIIVKSPRKACEVFHEWLMEKGSTWQDEYTKEGLR